MSPEESPPSPVEVLVVDDHPAVRGALRAYLGALGDVDVVAEAEDGRRALDELRTLAGRHALPHVVVLDLAMPRMDGVLATREIRARFPDVAVVVLAGFGQSSRAHAALTAGARACLSKDGDPGQLVRTLRTVADHRPGPPGDAPSPGGGA